MAASGEPPRDAGRDAVVVMEDQPRTRRRLTVGLWQRDADQPFFYLRRAGTVPPGKLLTSSSFSPDGRLVLATGRDGAVRLYRCEICGDLPALLELASARLRELRQ